MELSSWVSGKKLKRDPWYRAVIAQCCPSARDQSGECLCFYDRSPGNDAPKWSIEMDAYGVDISHCPWCGMKLPEKEKLKAAYDRLTDPASPAPAD